MLLDLYETIAISGFLTNAESWSLNKGEENEIEKVEIQSLKSLFDLPIHTPTAAIIFTLGIPFTKTFVHRLKSVVFAITAWFKGGGGGALPTHTLGYANPKKLKFLP